MAGKTPTGPWDKTPQGHERAGSDPGAGCLTPRLEAPSAQSWHGRPQMWIFSSKAPPVPHKSELTHSLSHPLRTPALAPSPSMTRSTLTVAQPRRGRRCDLTSIAIFRSFTVKDRDRIKYVHKSLQINPSVTLQQSQGRLEAYPT